MDYLTPIIGGVLIAAAAFLLFYFNGQICGISGMIEGVIPKPEPDWPWRLSFLSGLLFGGILLNHYYPSAFQYRLNEGLPTIVLAGLLVGTGSRIGLGCTSGHGVCGVGRFAPRSLVATALFILSGMITATYLKGWL